MLVVPAYAKVNLALEVLARRPDGFHDLATVMATIDWHDLVGVELSRGSGRVTLRLTTAAAGLPHAPAAGAAPAATAEGPEHAAVAASAPPAIPTGPDNLAWRAAAALVALVGGSVDVAVWLEKRVPAAAGLGGGSADAAAVLRAGRALLAASGLAAPPVAALLEVAASLGSDVPATLLGGVALASGRGERLTSVPAPPLDLAIAVAGASDTGRTYATLTDAERRGDGRAERVAAALRAGRAPEDADCGSALEAAARRAAPDVAAALTRLRAAVPAATWHLTGSGGAVFALAADAGSAGRLAAAARAAGFPARATRVLAEPLLTSD